MPPWRKIAIWSLAAISATVVGIILFRLEENWRGKYLWTRYKQRLAAQGEALDWNAYIPAPVADEENVLKAPHMTEWFVKGSDWRKTNSLYEALRSTTSGSLPTPITELTTGRAERFIAQCQQAEPDIAIIETALQRPMAHFDGDYRDLQNVDGLTPNFVSIRVLAQALAQRARCYLVLHQPDRALRDLTVMHDLSRLLKGKPEFLVTTMIDVAVTGLYTDSINQGLQLHLWNDAALRTLQAQLAEIDLVPGLPAGFRAERAGTLFRFEGLDEAGWINMFGKLGPGTSPTAKAAASASLPPRVRFHNLIVFSGIEQEIIAAFPTDHIVDPARLDAAQAGMNKKLKKPASDNLLARMTIPNFNKAIRTTVQNQVKADQAFIACGLECYWLAHGQYPDDIASLKPDYLDHVPVDIIGGQPFRYHRTTDGNIELYSVGWNKKDDNGLPDYDHGDWVWPML